MLLNLNRWCALAAMLGSVLWITGHVVHASKPQGCIAEECGLRPMREYGVLDSTLTLLGMLLLAIAAVGLAVYVQRAGRFGRLGRIGLILGVVGIALLIIGGLLQAVFFGSDFPLMPLFVWSGLLALVVGFLILGIAVLRAKVLPRWVAALLIVGALAMLGFNEQNTRVLTAIPLGVAWFAVGYVLWSGKGMADRQPSRVA